MEWASALINGRCLVHFVEICNLAVFYIQYGLVWCSVECYEIENSSRSAVGSVFFCLITHFLAEHCNLDVTI